MGALLEYSIVKLFFFPCGLLSQKVTGGQKQNTPNSIHKVPRESAILQPCDQHLSAQQIALAPILQWQLLVIRRFWLPSALRLFQFSKPTKTV